MKYAIFFVYIHGVKSSPQNERDQNKGSLPFQPNSLKDFTSEFHKH